MRKILFSFFLPFFFLCHVSAQNIPGSVEAAARFGSICCGPDSELFLKTFYKEFNKGKCRKVKAYKAGGCGKEGEFFILFSLKKLRRKNKESFLLQLDDLVTREEIKNKIANSSAGGIELIYNVPVSSLSYCRIPAVKW